MRSLPFFSGSNAPVIRPIPWLVEGLLAKGVGTILFGQPGVSKTVLTAILCACLCTGKAFAQFNVTGKHRVLYLDFDGGWIWSGSIFLAAFRGIGLEGLPDNFLYWSPLTDECKLASNDFVSLEHLGQLIEQTVIEQNIDLVVVDSLGQAMAGDGDKGQDAALGLRMGLNGARAAGAAILVIDHATKAARVTGQLVPTPSGSQQKRAWARLTVALEAEAGQDNVVRWSVDKSNTRHFVPFLTKVHFQLDATGQLDTVKLELLGEARERGWGTPSPREEAMRHILEVLTENGGEVSRKELGSSRTTDRALETLLKTGKIEKAGHGKYRLCTTTPPGFS